MERTERDIIEEINRLLGETEGYDPDNPAIDPAWVTLRTNWLPPPATAAVEANRRLSDNETASYDSRQTAATRQKWPGY